MTPVAGVAGEAEVPGSSSLPSLGSQSLAPWPDPAPQHRASPALSLCLQQWLAGKERHRQGGPSQHNPNPLPKPLSSAKSTRQVKLGRA